MSNAQRPLPSYQKVTKFISRFPDLQYDGSFIFCRICQIKIVGWTSYSCRRHVECARHKTNGKLQVRYSKVLYDVIFMLSVCGIPQYILDKEYFQVFWKKYVPKWPIPTRRQVGRHFRHVKDFLENDIRSELSAEPVWLTVDEIMDAKKNKVGNVLVCVLHPDKSSKPHLIASRRLENNNAAAIEELILGALNKFSIEKHNVLMLVTNESENMLKAGALLKKQCSNLLHITCLLHICHLVEETVRSSYPDVDKLIASTEMVFVQSRRRTLAFRKAYPQIPAPPHPILTKWGTWLQAAFYYDKYFETLKSVISIFDPKDAISVTNSQQQFDSAQVKKNLVTIRENYEILLNTIDQLQSRSLPLGESSDRVENLNAALQTLTCAPGVCAAEKLNNILSKIPDYAKVRSIGEHIRDQRATDFEKKFAYANITSLLDVERFPSKYNSTFASKRNCLSTDTVEGLLMMQMYAEFHDSASFLMDTN